MECPYPMLVRNKHGLLMRVSCGKCVICRLNRARAWSNRIVHECNEYPYSCVVTLTYDSDYLPEDYCIRKSEVQLFMKRFRKELGRPVRYFASGEYGTKGERRWINPHYHIILFGVSPYDAIFKNPRMKITKRGNTVYDVDLSSWKFGQVDVGFVDHDTARYVAGYNCKQLEGLNNGKVPLNNDFYKDLGLVPPFLLMSRRPGIGYRYVERFKEKLRTRNYIVGKNGCKCGLPRYYSTKIRTDDELVGHSDKVAAKVMYDLQQRALSTGKSAYKLAEEDWENSENLMKHYIKEKKEYAI